MSDISPISQPRGAALEGIKRSSGSGLTSPTAAVRSSDQAEFSRAAQLLSKLAQLPEVRQDLVDRVKAQIAAGEYDTPQRLDAALDELLSDFQ